MLDHKYNSLFFFFFFSGTQNFKLKKKESNNARGKIHKRKHGGANLRKGKNKESDSQQLLQTVELQNQLFL